MALGSVEAGEAAFLVVLLVSSVLNAAYFLPVSYIAFFGAESEARETPRRCARFRCWRSRWW